jgi:hypothetical protein
MCENIQHPNKHTCNRRLKKLERTLATYMYKHCNICNITIYFCNIHMKRLQHTSRIFETIETYSCNMRFQRNMSFATWQNGGSSPRWCVVFTGGSGLTMLVGGGPTGREASAAQVTRRPRPRDLERTASRGAWQGRQPSAATWRRPCAVLGKASGQAEGQQPCARRKRNEWIGISGWAIFVLETKKMGC